MGCADKSDGAIPASLRQKICQDFPALHHAPNGQGSKECWNYLGRDRQSLQGVERISIKRLQRRPLLCPVLALKITSQNPPNPSRPSIDICNKHLHIVNHSKMHLIVLNIPANRNKNNSP